MTIKSDVIQHLLHKKKQVNLVDRLQTELMYLSYQNNQLELKLSTILESQIAKEFNYLVYNDIKSLCAQSDVIVFHAPKGAYIDQPDPKSVEALYLCTHQVFHFYKENEQWRRTI